MIEIKRMILATILITHYIIRNFYSTRSIIYIRAFRVIESPEETRHTTLRFIYDSRALYRRVMLHASNPIKGLYFDMSTKSYVGKLATYKVSAFVATSAVQNATGYFVLHCERAKAIF